MTTKRFQRGRRGPVYVRVYACVPGAAEYFHAYTVCQLMGACLYVCVLTAYVLSTRSAEKYAVYHST